MFHPLYKLIALLLVAYMVPITVLAQSSARVRQAKKKIAVVDATITPNPSTLGSSISLRISVDLRGSQRIQKPTFNSADFDTIGQSYSEEIVTVVEGGRFVPKRKNVYTYILYPKKSGSLFISDIRLRVGRQVLSTEDVEVIVTGGSAPTNPVAVPNPNPIPKSASSQIPIVNNTNLGTPFRLNSDFTVRVRLDKKKSYVGEAIIAEYNLYAYDNLTQVHVKRWPTFTGFWKEDLEIPTRFRWRDSYVGRTRVSKALLGRFAIFPLKPGKVRLNKLLVSATYISNMHRNRTNDPFGNFFGFRMMKKAAHASQDETIEVLPLPMAGKPEDFTGAIGQFDIALKAKKKNLKVNEPLHLQFVIQGVGNFHAIEEPELKLPPELEMYESNTKIEKAGVQGIRASLNRTKIFEYLIIPRKGGDFTVPSLNWNYFDPEDKKYKKLSTDPIAITVAPGTFPQNISTPTQPTDSTSPTTGDDPAIILDATSQLRYLKPVDEVLRPRSSWQQNPIPLATILIFMMDLMLLGWIIYSRLGFFKELKLFKGDPRKVRIANALAKLNKKVSSKTSDFGALDQAIDSSIETLIDRDTTGMTKEEIREAWIERELPDRQIDQLLKIKETCNAQRFAPASSKSSSAAEFINHAKKLMKILKELRRL